MLPSKPPVNELRLRLPMILMVIAATAIPIELRPHDQWAVSFDVRTADVLANLVGYAPVGMVFAGLGLGRSILAGALLSSLCEASQVLMFQRSPSPIDLAVNVLGTALGALLATTLGFKLEKLRISRWMAVPAAGLCAALLLRVVSLAGDRRNPLDDPLPGVLVAHWRGDDSSGRQPPQLASGLAIVGGTADFDGRHDYIDLGAQKALQLTHSMSISAWINSRSFPSDDAPIVSDANGFGYQLDTTRDQGRRTVGFKLTDACGNLMARYGATTLEADTWYHVSGVYDSEAQTLHVYLNGKPDDGVLAGRVTSRQRQARRASKVYVGRRSGSDRFYFSGSIGDVRIYSLALTEGQVKAVMGGEDIATSPTTPARRGDLDAGCAGLSEDQDAQIPGIVAACGALLALIATTLFPSLRPLVCIALGAASGLAFYLAGPSGLPVFNGWMLPLVGAAGAGSIAFSLRRRAPS